MKYDIIFIPSTQKSSKIDYITKPSIFLFKLYELNKFFRVFFSARTFRQRKSFKTDVGFGTVRRMSLLAKSGKSQRIRRGKTFS